MARSLKIKCEAWFLERLVDLLEQYILQNRHGADIGRVTVLKRNIQRAMLRMVQKENNAPLEHHVFIHHYICDYTIPHAQFIPILHHICALELQRLHRDIMKEYNDEETDIMQYELHYINKFMKDYLL